MITELTLRNFKAFGDTPQRLPIKPLTLIFGANSSGKSSIIQSLLLMHHGESGSDFRELAPAGFGNKGHYRLRSAWEMTLPQLDVHQPKLGGTLIDLGGFRNYVHRHSLGSLVELGVQVDLRHPEIAEIIEFIEGAEGEIENFSSLGILLHVGLKPCRETYQWPSLDGDGADQDIKWITRHVSDQLLQDVARVQKCEILLDGTRILCFERTRPEAMELCPLNGSHPWAVTLSTRFRKSCDYDPRTVDFTDPEIAKNWEAIGGMFPDHLIEKVPTYFFSGIDEGTPGSVRRLCQIIRRVIAIAFTKLDYLGGLRALPPRQTGSAERNDANWNSTGLVDWQALCRKPDLLDSVNRWLSAPDRLSTKYHLRVRVLADTKTIATELKSLSELGGQEVRFRERLESALAELTDTGIQELILVEQATGTPVSYRDVGLGVSQILPVLVRAYGSEQQLHCIEQPEIHLHPALQAELGDVFIESALGERKNTFLLETHSEHLILRILRRVRETAAGTLPAGMPPVRPEDVSVVYVQPGPNGSEIIELPVTPDGDFDRPWPGGFFAERAAELF